MGKRIATPLTEQRSRAELLLTYSRSATCPVERHRLLMAAVYPAVAIAEQLVLNVDHDDDAERKAMERKLLDSVPLYRLLKDIRVHDFHRSTVMPPRPNFRMEETLGPIRLIARQGGRAGIMGTEPAMQKHATRNSAIKMDRPIHTRDGMIWSDEDSQFLDLHDVLAAYLEGLGPFVNEREPSAESPHE